MLEESLSGTKFVFHFSTTFFKTFFALINIYRVMAFILERRINFNAKYSLILPSILN